MTDRYDLKDVLWPDVPFDLLQHAILIGKRGSEAHGTYVPPTSEDGQPLAHGTDDRDIIGICIPPLDYYFGLKLWEGKDAIKDCWDVVLYSFRKFVGLLCEQNPNVISLLWLREEDYLRVSPEGRTLLQHRDLFRSKNRAFKSFVGYANGQLHRMTHLGPYKGYMGEKRKKLVDKYGYDCKNAAHLIRLLTMGAEFLRTGALRVYREDDREMLVDIKLGRWALADVQSYAAKLFEETKAAADNSPLPEHPDLAAINQLSVELTKNFFERQS
jgi:predicted nucleotidyltransferase